MAAAAIDADAAVVQPALSPAPPRTKVAAAAAEYMGKVQAQAQAAAEAAEAATRLSHSTSMVRAPWWDAPLACVKAACMRAVCLPVDA